MPDPDPRQSDIDRFRTPKRRTVSRRNTTLRKVVSFIYYLAGALEILLFLRFILRISGANPENLVAKFIYALSNPFVSPFSTLFQTPAFAPQHTFDISALIAIGVYALLAWLVARLVWIIWSNP
ncbi:yggt family protein [Leptolyngbya sp. Heron Island J]|uniref:YggT family protein n=1 Tax=Leptolyngbya sp. Heron Island J TaxID=1385935 RepID=UPI0003B99614|nr:YggT family protein [Leptolyngbya sp. Heron Island J]ESA34661.1 yggt family protein [Leptolyngbya sp. Heron Island J]